MPSFVRPIVVRPYFGYRSSEKLVLTARVLRAGEPVWERTRLLGKLATMVSQFATSEVPFLPVTLEIGGAGQEPLKVRQLSNRKGYVRFEVTFPARRALPQDPMWETVRLRWPSLRGMRSVDAYILAPGHNGRLAVISDIDDTIIETGAGDLGRNWRRLVMEMPSERTVVPGAVEFYGRLGGGNLGEGVPASRRPFFYVSSSPWNLFDYLVAFQKGRNLPQGPLLLRNWGLNRETFGHESHRAHKAGAITRLTEFYPDLCFALIGDDTQSDALAFADAVVAHPGRIAAVFIRRAPGSEIDPGEQAALDAIAGAGVAVWSGASWDVGAEFLDQLGFTPGGETAGIVAAIATAHDEPAP